MQVDWMHLEPGGNSGVSTCGPTRSSMRDGLSERRRDPDSRSRVGAAQYTRGPAAAADRLRPRRVHSRRRRDDSRLTTHAACAAWRSRTARKGHGEWNTYTVVAVDGVIKLAVNGKFVNGIAQLVAEEGLSGSQVGGRRDSLPQHRIMELLPGVTSPGADRARSALKDLTPAMTHLPRNARYHVAFRGTARSRISFSRTPC